MINVKLRVARKASMVGPLAPGVVLIVVCWSRGLRSQVRAQVINLEGQVAARPSDLGPVEPLQVEVRSVMSAAPRQSDVERRGQVIDIGLRYIEFDRLTSAVPAIKKAVPVRELAMRTRHSATY
jgi:hypothetical protein